MYYQQINNVVVINFIVLNADIALLILEHKPSVKAKNNLGWTPLNEAVSMGDREAS